MARVIALAQSPQLHFCRELLRMMVVCGCALALIAAGQWLPAIAF